MRKRSDAKVGSGSNPAFAKNRPRPGAAVELSYPQCNEFLYQRIDESRVIYFQDTYSRMSDYELAYLLATRSETLVEEARLALSNVLKTRDLTIVKAEVKATIKDLEDQAQVKNREKQEQIARQRAIRKGFNLFCLVLSALGLLLLTLGDNERDGILIAAGLIGSAVFELRRLASRFIVALFTMN